LFGTNITNLQRSLKDRVKQYIMGLVDPKDAILLRLIETIPGIRYNQLSRLTGFAHGMLCPAI
jgi:hypothetical protein